MGNLHKCHSSSVFLKPEEFWGKPISELKILPSIYHCLTLWSQPDSPLTKSAVAGWHEVVDSQTAEDSTAWHEDLSFGKINSRELTQALGHLWHLLSQEKPCSTDACDTDGNAALNWKDPSPLLFTKLQVKCTQFCKGGEKSSRAEMSLKWA